MGTLPCGKCIGRIFTHLLVAELPPLEVLAIVCHVGSVDDVVKLLFALQPIGEVLWTGEHQNIGITHERTNKSSQQEILPEDSAAD